MASKSASHAVHVDRHALPVMAHSHRVGKHLEAVSRPSRLDSIRIVGHCCRDDAINRYSLSASRMLMSTRDSTILERAREVAGQPVIAGILL